MKILAFDTTDEYVSTAILDDDIIIDQIIFNRDYAHAETILIALESILAKNNCSYRDFDYIACVNGPSSFIKIRIGLACAYGLRFATEKKLIAVNLFETYNHIICDAHQEKIIILHAFKENFYIQIQNYLQIIDQKSVTLSELQDFYKDSPSFKIFCDQKSFLILENSLPCNLVKINNNAAICAQYAYKKIINNCEPLPNNITPFYLINPVFKTLIMQKS